MRFGSEWIDNIYKYAIILSIEKIIIIEIIYKYLSISKLLNVLFSKGGLEFKLKKLRPIYSVGESHKKGNRKLSIVTENHIIFKPT